MSTAAIIVIALLMSAYGWIASMELGAALMHFLPRFNHEPASNRLFTATWEVANVFLLLAYVCFVVVFHAAAHDVIHATWGLVLVALDMLVIRACLISRPAGAQAPGKTVANALLVLACVATPVAFGTIGVAMLTGDVFWHTSTGWVLLALQVIGLLSLGVSFVYWRAGRHATNQLRWASRLLIFTFAALTAVDLQAAVSHISPHLFSLPYALFVMLVACSVLWEMALLTSKRSDRAMWWYVSAIVLIGPTLLALANRPWLMYGAITLHQAYGASRLDAAVLVAISIVSVALLIGFARRLFSLLRAAR